MELISKRAYEDSLEAQLLKLPVRGRTPELDRTIRSIQPSAHEILKCRKNYQEVDDFMAAAKAGATVEYPDDAA